jgi:hypothetical protein
LNGYTINYFHDASKALSFQIELYQKAEDFSKQGYKVNENDNLGTLYIYNTEAQGINNDFSVVITVKDETDCSQAPDATYDETTRRVIWTADATLIDEKCILMPNIDSIALTAKAP